MLVDDVRCPGCRRLLGRRLPDNRVETRHGDRFHALIQHGSISCPKCKVSISVCVDETKVAVALS